MLRLMVFKNFVHFRDIQKVQFERGPNFLFGGNCTGKSVILELIRRSMTTGCNYKITKPFDSTGIAFAFSKFDMSPAESDIWSGLLIKGEICFKLTVEKESNRAICKVSKYTVDGEKLAYKKTEISTFEISENEFPFLVKDGGDFDLEKVSDSVQLLYEKILKLSFKMSTEDEVSPTDDVLERIKKSYVATFFVRSPSPVQWSRSKLIDHCRSDENYEEANRKAEIMQDLLPKLQDDKTYQETLNYLCHPIKYKAEIKEKHITVNGQPLLKTPIGVIEAIHFSLITACEEFKTICLEEPDTGMHPQMVERMRDILLRKCRDVVVIVVSHNHAFINNWTMPNINVCVRKRTNNNHGDTIFIHKALSFKGFSDRILDLDDMKKLLFSSKIIGVEGKRDKIFLETFFSYIWETINSPKAEEGDKFPKPDGVLGNQIICLQSKTAAKNTTDLCQLIDLPCTLLLDRDAHVKLQKDKKKIQNIRLDSDLQVPFSKQYFNFEAFHGGTLDRFLSEGFERLCHILNSRNIFIWRQGGLEDMIVDSVSPEKLEEFKSKEENTNKKSKKKGVEILDLTREQLRTLVVAVYTAGPLKELYDFLSSFENGLE